LTGQSVIGTIAAVGFSVWQGVPVIDGSSSPSASRRRSPETMVVRFGAYELDGRAGELRKHGYKVRLQNKPFRILELLLANPGHVVTREELRAELWPENVFVDFDHGLNSAVNKLRDALFDSAAQPRFIETTPRGYRFIGAVELPPQPILAAAPDTGSSFEPAANQIPTGVRQGRIVWKLASIGIAAAALAVLASVLTSRLGARPTPSQIAVAVLPFENLNADPEQDFFSDGFTDALIAQVGRAAPNELRVIARASAMRYKRTDKTATQIGQELGVDYILEGSVLRAGSRVRITGQLVRTLDQAHVWSQSYERDLRDVLALQSEVARAIAEQVEITFKGTARRSAGGANVDPAVYEAYLKGRYFVDRGTKAPHAVGYFEQAIAADPTYAPAYAGLADAHGQTGWALSAEMAPEPAYRKALAAAEQALKLDEGLASAHVALGRIRWKYEFDFRAAEHALTRAIELDPNSAVAHESYFDLLSAMGRHEEAYARLRRGARSGLGDNPLRFRAALHAHG
jgi:TolB-like protein/DNA-binding winged helix-turn-helix (wHTH) protein